MDRTSFRTSWTQPEGLEASFHVECQVVDLNLTNWTVDVISKFDQRRYFNVQISSPYMHFNRGEGIFVMPDIGAKCHVCIPSDGPPPYVADFIMPMETIDGASEDAPDGTDGGKGGVTQESTAASFAGGRKRAKPGDIIIRNRDGSFIILHRGGVLQIGATELAQRIYVPLQNLITDISQTYRHQNIGGSINWFVAPGESSSNPPTVQRNSYRLLAGDDKATLRVAYGKVSDVLKEQDAKAKSDLTQLGIGGDAVVCEVVVSPDQIDADTGGFEEDAAKSSVLRYFFDKAGNVLLRTEANIVLRAKKKLRLRIDDNVEIFGGKNLTLEFEGTARIQVANGIDISGGVIRLNGGSKAIATVGSIVTLTLAAPVPIATSAGPGTILVGAQMIGVVTSGNPTVLA
jgi:hypothetical protein